MYRCPECDEEVDEELEWHDMYTWESLENYIENSYFESVFDEYDKGEYGKFYMIGYTGYDG